MIQKLFEGADDAAIAGRLLVLDDAERFEGLLREPRAVLLKHSAACSVSFNAMREVRKFLVAHEEVRVHVVDVLGSRELSLAIADRLDVPHQSPQVIVLRGGKVAWHASHFSITASALVDHV